jgi:hypothetical protein
MTILLFLLLQQADGEHVRAQYTKYEHEIPARDGKKLFTAVYVPKSDGPHPILLTRTPYGVGPYGADAYKTRLGPSDKMEKEGYIFAYQDVRGRHMSEGEFVNMRPYLPKKGPQDVDESSDTYDTIDWLLRNVPKNNGRVGQWGISYPGFYTAIGMIDAHPALKASSPQAPIADWFVGDDFHHNGAFYLAHAYRFFSSSGRPQKTPTLPIPAPPALFTDAYDFFLEAGTLADINEKVMKKAVPFWNDMMAHGTYDEFWKSRNLRPHLKAIKPAVMSVGGWFDAENLFGALHVYASVERQSPETRNVLVMGPWWHGGWAGSDGSSLGAVRFNAKTSVWYRDEVEAVFFRSNLKSESAPAPAEATVFETGANQWRQFPKWPPDGVVSRALYLREGGRLAFAAPADEDVFDEYASDPAKPVPFTASTAGGMTREHMLDDQRFAATRPDVLVYRSEPLDRDLTIAGPILPSLHVSTTGTDSDWVVKLIDVYPDSFPDPDPNPTGVKMAGYQQLVRGECFRGKFRKSFESPEPFTPGKPERIDYTMPDAFHTFRKGHRIMLQIQSSWFPLVDRNPQTFTDIYSARAEEFRKAVQRVYRSKDRPSALRLGVLTP